MTDSQIRNSKSEIRIKSQYQKSNAQNSVKASESGALLASRLDKPKTNSEEQQLCLSCGLCCNGVIFADVHLQAGDDAGRLRELGLPLCGARKRTKMSESAALKFAQPCAALNGCACRIYPERPTYCRHFECLLLKGVKSGKVQRDAAVKIIREAQKRAERVRRLLRALGNKDEQVALSVRFRRTKRSVSRANLDKNTAAIYGELTLAVHDLNCLLSEAFYPGR